MRIEFHVVDYIVLSVSLLAVLYFRGVWSMSFFVLIVAADLFYGGRNHG